VDASKHNPSQNRPNGKYVDANGTIKWGDWDAPLLELKQSSQYTIYGASMCKVHTLSKHLYKGSRGYGDWYRMSSLKIFSIPLQVCPGIKMHMSTHESCSPTGRKFWT